MRILWLSHMVPWPPKGGAYQRSYHLLRVAAAHHLVHLVALDRGSAPPEPDRLRRATEAFKSLCARVDIIPVEARHPRLQRVGLLLAGLVDPRCFDERWLANESLQALLTRLASTERFDLLHVDTVGMAPYAGLFPNHPLVLNHHNVESDMMRRRVASEGAWLRRLYLEREALKLELFEKQQCRRAAVNLVVSDLDAARLREIAPSADIRVVENGTDPSFFEPPPGRRTEPRSLVFAGGMNWYPNCDAVLYFLRDIWPLLGREPEPHTWTVVGQNPPSALLEAARRDPGIRVMGFVDDVRPHLHSAQIYVCPIRKGGGTRLKVLDALASGTPLVSTRMAVEGLDLNEGTHYLAAEEPADFVTQIRRLESDPALRLRLSTSGKDIVVRRYSWSGIGEKLLDAYRFACSASPSRGEWPSTLEERAP